MMQLLTVRHLDQPGSQVTAAATGQQHHRMNISVIITIVISIIN